MVIRSRIREGSRVRMEMSVLFSEMTPAPEWEADFNTWYDKEHIPLRMAVPGFSGAQRYKRGALDYLAVYDMTEPDVLESDAYLQVKDHPSEITAWMLKSVDNFTRYVGRPISNKTAEGAGRFSTCADPLSCPVHRSRSAIGRI